MYLRPVWKGTLIVALVLAGIAGLLKLKINKNDTVFLMIEDGDAMTLVHDLHGGEGQTDSFISKTGLWSEYNTGHPKSGVGAQAVYSVFWIPDSLVWTYEFDREFNLTSKIRTPEY